MVDRVRHLVGHEPSEQLALALARRVENGVAAAREREAELLVRARQGGTLVLQGEGHAGADFAGVDASRRGVAVLPADQ
jgi:hypothetical protein